MNSDKFILIIYLIKDKKYKKLFNKIKVICKERKKEDKTFNYKVIKSKGFFVIKVFGNISREQVYNRGKYIRSKLSRGANRRVFLGIIKRVDKVRIKIKRSMGYPDFEESEDLMMDLVRLFDDDKLLEEIITDKEY